MRYSISPYDYGSHSYYAPRPAPRCSPPPPPPPPPQYHRRQHCARPLRTSTWPPSPSVEDDVRQGADAEGQPPANTRGTVDQEPLLDDLDAPSVASDSVTDDRRFVLVSEPSTDDDGSWAPATQAMHRQSRRPSVAERGNLTHIKPTIDPPSFFAERISTPYAYTRPQTESLASGDSSSDSPTRRPNSTRPPPRPRNNTFGDSDLDADETTRLRTGRRQPARYSFVKNDLHREHLRTSTCDTLSRPSLARRDSGQAPRPSKHHAITQSPRSSASSLNCSPKQQTSSPKLPIRQIDSTLSPLPAIDPSRLPPRHGRVETMLAPTPSIDVRIPSPSRQANAAFSLPYPIDDRPADAFMPPEEHYQFNHAPIAEGLPAGHSPSALQSPHQEGAVFPCATCATILPDVPSHATSINTEIIYPYAYLDGKRTFEPRRRTSFDLMTSLPSCPRSAPSYHDDWYSLRGYESFDVCPTCFDSSFAKSCFASDFSQSRLYMHPTERICDFSSPWVRIAWLLTIRQRLQSLQLLYMLADIAEDERPCPGDREVGAERVDWYGILDHNEGTHVANFAICSCDKNMLEALFPIMRRLFTRLPTSHSHDQCRYICSLRPSSRRSRGYLDVLVELDAEAQSLLQPLDVSRFVQLVRDNAYKGECCRDKALIRKPWHFAPSLPEFTVCEECYDELVWPAMHSGFSQSTFPCLFNKTLQLVPGEDPDLGSSCCLYSPRMRRIWDISIRKDDLSYLTRKALERKRAELSLSRERKGIMKWMVEVEKGSKQWERAKRELTILDQEWAAWQ
ncbi:hypothetical protein T440DRAFT_424036 [Plenodomus tracheiphilus IPT5]|uniref:Uncharacterized protein n=1 Tax=Plenodomus tracheiphilus IPT5 TaxID=1408161 RepID=A0A6A7BA36_9PLEO|nr:hypothetical protein T440DRAFT_424036 [Plenodomus tracheiphilus IPT5]